MFSGRTRYAYDLFERTYFPGSDLATDSMTTAATKFRHPDLSVGTFTGDGSIDNLWVAEQEQVLETNVADCVLTPGEKLGTRR